MTKRSRTLAQDALPEPGLDRVPRFTFIRLRLFIALAATAAIPIVIGMLLVPALQASPRGLGPNLSRVLPPFAAVAALLMLALSLSRQVLRPARELAASRSQLRRLYERAREESLQDALTSLGNHRAFHEEFDRQLEHARRHNVPLALMLLDIDDFKAVNDSAGHATGDDLLAEVGRLIAASLRRTDRAYRIGGDEFAILMPHTDPEAGLMVGRRLLSTTLQSRTEGGFRQPISFSGGISASPSLASSRTELYTQADEALYWCKRHGRTSVEIHDARRARGADKPSSPELSAAVGRVAEGRLIKPVYQPIVELTGGRIVGYEGLVRPLPNAGFSNPGELFEAAESSGRVTELDYACLDVVIAGAAAIPAHQLVTLNMSPRSLEAPEFNVPSLLAILARSNVVPGRVIIELTEREPVEDFDRLRENLAACQRAGLRIAADDVGAGNAGLRLLSQIHFDIVKIDLSLVQGGPVRESSMAVLKSLCDLAGRWGALVIAEGIETAEQLRVVRELRVSAAQGYLLGRPSDAVDLEGVDLDRLEARDAVPYGLGARHASPGSIMPAARPR